MKRSIVLIGLALSLIATPALADGNWTITNFQSDLTIQEDGILDVVETIDADFSSEPHHGIYRDVPFRYNVDGRDNYMNLTVVEVKRNGLPEQSKSTSNSANVRIKIGDPDLTITGEHTYTIHYTVVGALRSFADYDELNWDVTGHEWEVPIKRASATLSLPKDGILQSACYTGDPGSTERHCDKGDDTTQKVSYSTQQPIELGQDFTVAVGFTKNLAAILVGIQPYNPITDPKSYAVAGAIALLALFALLRNWWRSGRDEQWQRSSLNDPNTQAAIKPLFATHEAIVPEYAPPGDLRPAELAVALTESSGSTGISATIVDLAVRGFLTVTQVPKRSWFGTVDYLLKRTTANIKNLRAYEVALLDALFRGSKETSLKALKRNTSLATKIMRIHKQIYQEVTDRKIFIGNPQKRRNTLLIIGLCLMIGMIATAAITTDSPYEPLNSWITLGSILGFLVAGFASIFFSFLAPKRSAAGSELLRQIRGYRLFLSDTERYRQPFLENQGLFMKVLPYAMIFGVTQKLVKAMKAIGVSVQQPTWYVGTGTWNHLAFANEITSLTSAVSTMSSSSASGGGGSSGGGGGGGGGGGW